MYFSIVVLPLISSFVSAFFGRYIGRYGACVVTILCLFVCFMNSLFIFYEVCLNQTPCVIKLTPWFFSETLRAGWGFLFDQLTSCMLIVVTSVSCLVHLYSSSYMGHDPHQPRFMSYLSLFTFFMIILVTADNFIQMFFGWEGVGLASYLLINFWFTRLQANKSALKAMLVNRVGDFGLALGIALIYVEFRSMEYGSVFAASSCYLNESFFFPGFSVGVLTLACFGILWGAVGKSAQLGLHTWLPDAMEGPTPVSALIHAATMVTAGVFLIVRCSPLFELSPEILVLVSFCGASTAFFAATVGVVQNDLKRVIAYSTCSQLGYMIAACGLSCYSVSFFHLANHAFFKALLFLSAGCVIHGVHDEQDMRKMGGLALLMPYTYIMMMIGSLALVGFPFLTGFYSKDLILELAFGQVSFSGTFVHWLCCSAAFFTSFYSFRLAFLTFLSKTNASRKTMAQAHDGDFRLSFPLFVLAIGSIFVGYCCRDMAVGMGTSFWGSAIFHSPLNNCIVESEVISVWIKHIPFFLTLFGGILAYIFTSVYRSDYYHDWFMFLTKDWRHVYSFASKKWFFDHFYNEILTRGSLNFGYQITFKTIDKGVIEFFGPTGLPIFIYNNISKLVSNAQSGFLYHYALIMLVSVSLLVCVLLTFSAAVCFSYKTVLAIFGFYLIWYYFS